MELSMSWTHGEDRIYNFIRPNNARGKNSQGLEDKPYTPEPEGILAV